MPRRKEEEDALILFNRAPLDASNEVDVATVVVIFCEAKRAER